MIQSNIRVPEELWKELKKIAEEDERSINGEIIYIIKKFIEQKKES